MSFSVRRFDRDTLKTAFSAVNWNASGKVARVLGEVVEACLPGGRIGMVVAIGIKGLPPVLAEVVGIVDEGRVKLVPYGNITGIAPGSPVHCRQVLDRIPVGDFLLGQVVDPMLQGLRAPLEIPPHVLHAPLDKSPPNPLLRARVNSVVTMGIKSMDGLLTIGEGQRFGIMAGSGVGKSVLMGMIARGSSADVNVIGLIGERGREVREFIERDLGKEGLARSVVVCSTSDQSPLMRLRAAKAVTAIAEAFSQQGKNVLLMMDSLTRVAMAQREIGIAAGEPPTTKGYPPSVYALLPRLLERAGPQPEGCGSITGLYTVLVDGDDFNDPIPDQVRSILDGHINLSRSLASKGHYPAIEVTSSISRVMHDIVSEEHWQLAQVLRTLLGAYQDNFDMVQLGAYQAGTNPTLDSAIGLMPAINAFLRQDMKERTTLTDALTGMRNIFKSPKVK